MKTLIRNPKTSWTIRIALILAGVTLIAGFGFLQGILYANRRATIKMAYDNCIFSWSALTALRDTNDHRWVGFFDRELDPSASKLSEMCLEYPNLIERGHYNLLVRVREYRKEYGRNPESNSFFNPVEVDRHIAEAVAYLESIHDTNDWGRYKFDSDEKGIFNFKLGR